MNSIFSFVTFTTELEVEYESGYLPTLNLDIEMLPSGIVTHRYYEKTITVGPMSPEDQITFPRIDFPAELQPYTYSAWA